MSRPPRAVYNVDRDLRFITANETALVLWGKSRSDIVGRTILDVFPETQGSEPYAALQNALRDYRPFRAVLPSPVTKTLIDLEIHPGVDGLRVSFSTRGPASKR